MKHLEIFTAVFQRSLMKQKKSFLKDLMILKKSVIKNLEFVMMMGHGILKAFLLLMMMKKLLSRLIQLV